jgi:uncharacterized protein (TIGR02145 family)
MKTIRLYYFIIPALLICSFTAKAQDENPMAGEPIKDIDGNTYKVTMTEEGVWLTENLRTTKFNDGTSIPLIKDHAAWATTKTKGYGWYSDDANYRKTYGAIYNWHTVKTGKLCPKGWHVPTEAEWNDLLDYAGTPSKSGNNPSKLKEKGSVHWKSPNDGAENAVFFTALPAGEVSYFYTDAEPGTRTSWWTATEDKNNLEPGQAPSNAEVVGLTYDFQSKSMGTYEKWSGLPVRCKADE